MEHSTLYRGLCLIGGCIICAGSCVNCGARREASEGESVDG